MGHIRGNTKLVALLGDPVAHSLSPQIHNAAFAHDNLNVAYIPLQVRTGHLHSAVQSLRGGNFLGANVTIPHKQQIVHYCDVLSPLSAAITAVNTLSFKDGLLCGTSTDSEGFFAALRHMGHDRRGGHVVVLGTGGTARTLGFAMALEGTIESLTIAGRSVEKVTTLADDITRGSGMPVATSSLDPAALRKTLEACTLLVNCTSVGMHPNIEASPIAEGLLHNGITVFDTIYNPAETKLIAMARKADCPAQNGLRMLVYQGLASFKLWTGITVDESIFDFEKLQGMVNPVS